MKRNEPPSQPIATDYQIQSLKRSILWNQVQAGDPYDIRKSMIARLPGDKKIFMGNKLQLICLLQAAQIERLALNLQEYRAKFYEIQKNSLDRHSYEIQIKELADNLQKEEVLRTQNHKLKKFSERLNQELEQAKAKLSTGNAQLSNNYQQALLQIQNINEQNARFQIQISNLKLLVTTRTSENKELSGRIVKMQEEINQHREDQQKMEEYQNRFHLIGEQIKRLNLVLKAKTEEYQAKNEEYQLLNLQLQQSQNLNLKLKEQNTNLNRQISKLQEQINKPIGQLELVSSQKEAAQLSIYEDKVTKALREVDRLNGTLQRLQIQKDQLNRSLGLSQQKNSHYSNIIKEKSEELSRAQQKNRQNEAASRQLRKQLEQLQFQYRTEQVSTEKIIKTNNDLLVRINQLSLQTEKSKLTDQKYGKLSDELKRLTQKSSNLQIQNRSVANQNKLLQTKLKDGQHYQFQMKRLMKQLSDVKNIMIQEDISKRNQQERIGQLSKKTNQYERIIEELSNQIKRLNAVLKIKITEISTLETRANHFNSEYQNLQQRNPKITENRQKTQEYENKIALFNTQIQRIQTSLDGKASQNNKLQHQIEYLVRENNNLRQQLNQNAVQQGKRNYGDDARDSNLLEYRNEIIRLNEVNRVKFQEMNSQINRLISINNQLKIQLEETHIKQKEVGDLERLNTLLRLKIEESAKWQASNKQLTAKTQYLQSTLESLSASNREIRVQIQNSLTEKAEAQRQLNEYRLKAERMLMEVQRLHQILQNLQNEIKGLKKQNSELKKELGQSGSALSWKEKNEKLFQQISRLNAILKSKEEQLKELRTILTQDYALERRLKEQMSLITLRNRVNQKEEQVETIRRESLAALKD